MEQSAEAAAASADEKLAMGQLAVNLGGYINDIPMRQRGAKLILDSGKLDPAKVPDFQYYLGSFAYSNKDYATASSALAAAVAANYNDPQAGELMVDAYAKAGQPAQGLAALKQAVAAKRAAGQPVPEAWLKRANVVAYNSKLGTESVDWALTQVELYPNAFNWLGSAQLVRRFGNYGPNETIDLFRLMMRSGAFDNDPKLVGNEYREYIQTADPRRLPGEVIKAIDKGTAAGALSGPFVTESRTLAQGRIAADKASLPAAAAKAASSASGLDALSTGDAYLNYGEAAKAEALYKLALGKSGVDKDRVLTRLGIAQYDQGDFAGARASFKQVGGTRAPLARLWLALINTKAPSA
jgi:tetratricopeptide (TPR) repeat protein